MAGVNALHDHPLYTQSAVALTTTSGVHAATIAEYAVTVLLALAHRVPRMVEGQATGAWPPDDQRWPLVVPADDDRCADLFAENLRRFLDDRPLLNLVDRGRGY